MGNANEKYIYQHPSETPGTWQKAMTIRTCPYDYSRYISAYFDQGKDFVHDYQDPKFWLTKEQMVELTNAAKSNGYKLISNRFAKSYGI